jgi:tetrahydromethanopterin S-methyltransferase subunit F
MMFFYVLGRYRLNLIVLDGKLATGHKKQKKTGIHIAFVWS